MAAQGLGAGQVNKLQACCENGKPSGDRRSLKSARRLGQPSIVYSAFLSGYPLSLSISLIAKVHFEFALKGEKHDWQGDGHEPGPFQVHIGGIRLLLRTKANTNVMY